MKYFFNLLTVLGVSIAIYTLINWGEMPVLQRLLGLFLFGIILHVWEESRLPGGFTDMITKKLNFTQKNPFFGEFVTGLYILIIAFVPFFFHNITFLVIAPMMLGILEVLAHLVAIKMTESRRFYSPGLFTTVLLPISVYAIVYAVQHNLMRPIDWLYSFLYIFLGLMLAQQIVVRTSGMKYSEFMKNVRKALFSKEKTV